MQINIDKITLPIINQEIKKELEILSNLYNYYIIKEKNNALNIEKISTTIKQVFLRVFYKLFKV